MSPVPVVIPARVSYSQHHMYMNETMKKKEDNSVLYISLVTVWTGLYMFTGLLYKYATTSYTSM